MIPISEYVKHDEKVFKCEICGREIVSDFMTGGFCSRGLDGKPHKTSKLVERVDITKMRKT